MLAEATENGRTVALGLFNRVRRIGRSVLYLGEAGSSAVDCPYVEQNGILTEAGREAELTALCLAPLVTTHDVVLSGVAAPTLEVAHRVAGLVVTERSQASPFIDLGAVRRSGRDYLEGRSANTRQQLRRSDRFYQRSGPITVERAGSTEAAHAMVDRMGELHQAVWTARGKPGSFAAPFFRRFHDALVAVGLPRGEIAVLKISTGETEIGFLYNFVWRRRMLAYQSGFVYRNDSAAVKPGLTCHLAAIRHALLEKFDIYDFLAGEDRYKRSLADQSHQQFWLRVGPFWSWRLQAQAAIQRFRATLS
jgi:CelD/BcsL family acetyltransferase involved in cellulose biosynthesis